MSDERAVRATEAPPAVSADRRQDRRRASVGTSVVDRALRTLAVTLAAALVVAALHDASQAYDVWYYHLPFAARLVGLVDAHEYVFGADNQARFEGFPLFGELLQGVLWRLTGHPAATNLLSLGALFALPFFLRRAFGVPLHVALLALLAIPLVMIHATSSYVDLPANALATVLVLCVLRALVAEGAPSARSVIGCGLLAAAVANMKFQLVPLVVVAASGLFVLALRGAGSRSKATAPRAALVRRLLAFVVMTPVVFATPLKNVIVHGNPVWPIELRVLGHDLPHAEEAYESSPAHLASTSRPVRFARSVLEIDNRPIASHRRWSLDQWAPSTEPGYRMGGFFGAYVVVNLIALAIATVKKRTRASNAAALVFGVATIVAAVAPQSHELRYYLFWMLLLVSLNVIAWGREAPHLVGAIAVAALAVVAWSTDAAYLYPSGATFAELVEQKVDRTIVDAAADGAHSCVDRQPFTFLHAALFHPPRRYVVEEAGSDGCRHGAPPRPGE